MSPHPAIYSLLWLEPVIPFVSAFILMVFGRRLGRRVAAWLGSLAIFASFIISLLIGLAFMRAPDAAFTQIVWHWIAVGNFHVDMGLYLDALAVVMTLVVSFVSFLIHVYSTEHMEESEGYERFFAYMNLFVASMLTLTLANNLLLLLLGWEGVGLCSYLLIGFWYGDEANGRAGRKAFIVTRAGDTAFILGLFLLFNRLGTLNIQQLMLAAQAHWHVGAMVAEVAAFLLIGGAVGKSAQLPLQTWLPDAMAGPTPTSALIHAATMVTAGVYLIARTHVLFELAPGAMLAVAIIGFATLLLAGCSALTQTDIKRILAYSTVSQIGYMFLALGVGAWSAAIFHLISHAFFKALLFLASGVVIHALNDEHNIFKMGGLRHKQPLAFWCFVFAGSSLAGLPLISAGFYSKGMIIWQAWSSPSGHMWLWVGALVGAFLTALYIFRLIFVTFYGEEKNPPQHWPRWTVQWPMIILAFLSMLAGFFDLPPALGGGERLTHFLSSALPMLAAARPTGLGEIGSEAVAAAVFFVGVYIIYLFQIQNHSLTEALMAGEFGQDLYRFWYSDWGMDRLYDLVFVIPTIALVRRGRHDVVDQIFEGIGWLCRTFYGWLWPSETGKVRRYAAWIAAGAIFLIVVVLW
ncbi:MAG: NADH-quinone oxidoreductase subunit L [Terriglobales bacterium]